MSYEYQVVPDPGAGLRLHLNENTAGCSPRVIAAVQAVTREQAAFYPDYSAVQRETARYFGVGDDCLLLTNGLDEGIHAAANAWLQRGPDGATREAIVVEPAFDMYAACADAAGGRVVAVAPRPGFEFPLEETLAAVTRATRLVYLNTPNNPTGATIPQAAIVAIARALPSEALLFLDEAYADFGREHFLTALDANRNVVVGRTFAKAHGLAAVRVGAVIGAPAVIARLRRVVPPYSVNVFAIAALRAALADGEYLRWYASEVAESKRRIYELCDRLKVAYWPSDANFVLLRIGPRAQALVKALASRGVFVRDRTGEPGCAGCIRVTAGVVEHTGRLVTALEEELCAAR